MDVLAPVRAFDRYQQRHRALSVPLAIQKKFSDDSGSALAALIAYYGFLALFPLLLLFVSVLGFVLQHNPGALQSIENSALKDFPVIGQQLKPGHVLHGSVLGVVIGGVGAVMAGLSLSLAVQRAFDQVHAVPRRERRSFFGARLHGLGLLAFLGIMQVVSTAVSGVVSGGLGGAGAVVGGIVVSLLLNLVLFTVAFRLLTERSVIPARSLWPGIVMAAVGWEILQAVGGVYIGHVLRKSGETYGTFATVIGLLAWLFLGARLLVYAAELNSVLAHRLWPRSLLGPPVPADDRALVALAKTEERQERERVDVQFDPPADGSPPGRNERRDERRDDVRRPITQGSDGERPGVSEGGRSGSASGSRSRSG
jgi:YihY family inner membrane protein